VFSVFAGRHSPVTAGRHRHHPASLPGYWLPVLLLGAVCLAACSTSTPAPPTALEPAEGHPHDVVLIKGTDLKDAQIVWDKGGPDERVIPGGYQGAYMFSVPHDAVPLNETTAREYAVAVRKKGVDSTPVTFTVPPMPGPRNVARPPGPPPEGRIYPPPRIDAVTIVGATFESSDVRATLYVQGANLDVGAIVSVTEDLATDPVPVATTSHRVLRNDWLDVSDENFDYPIYHYSSVIALPGVRPAGQRIWVFVTNIDNVRSKAFEYKLPSDADTIDSDGDGLRDTWETGGYHADGDGVVDINLPALGADPYRRDIFLELDVMEGVQHKPTAAVFDGLRQMFEAAPIINVGEPRGINLVIDTSTPGPCLPKPGGGEQCSFATIIFDIGGQTGTEVDPFATGKVIYSRLKEHSFDNAKRDNVFHYGIWAIMQQNKRSGWSDDADDLVISFDDEPPFGLTYHTTRSQIEALAHELGHSLAQKHGGQTDWPERKPNYLSVMSKTWLHRSAWGDSTRLERATCLPLYYAAAGATEGSSGSTPSVVNTTVDYSEGMGRELVRPGSTSMCGKTITWSTVEPPSVVTINDFANWPALVFNGPAADEEGVTP